MRLRTSGTQRRNGLNADALVEPLEPRALLAGAASSALSALSFSPGTDTSVVADINNDGRPDTIVPTATGFQVRYKRPSGLEAVFDVNTDGGSGLRVEHIAVGHFDDDGRLDIAISLRESGPIAWTAPGAIQVFSSRAGGVFVSIGSVPAKGVVALAAGNFDGDARDDLIAERVLNASGTPTRFEVRRYVVGGGAVRSSGLLFQWTGVITRPIVTDVDGDGQTDVLIGVRAGSFLGDASVQLFHGQGNGTFAQQELYRFSTPAAIAGLSVGDVDGDGRKDIAIASWDGTTTSLSYLAAQSGGGFATPSARVQIAALDPLLPADERAAAPTLLPVFAIGDFDHDGLPDIRVQVRRVIDLSMGGRPTSGLESYKINLESDGMGGFTSRTELIERSF